MVEVSLNPSFFCGPFFCLILFPSFYCLFRASERIQELTSFDSREIRAMVIDISIRDFLYFYRNEKSEHKEEIRKELINYLAYMNLSLLGNMAKYEWFGEFQQIVCTAPGLSYLMQQI